MDSWEEVENLPKELRLLKYSTTGQQYLESKERWELFKRSNEYEKLKELKESLLRNVKNLVNDKQ